jgi:protein-disulfide isomerase
MQYGHTLGADSSGVTLVEFADFECPYCRRFEKYIDSIRSLGYHVRVVYRHFPLSIHRFAVPAARASECANEQGRFEQMHAILFANSDSLGLAPWWWFARTAGVRDSGRFDSCVRSPSAIRALQRDAVDGNRLGVHGTPTILMDGFKIEGVPPFDSLKAYVQRVRGDR